MATILFLAHRIPYPPNKGDKLRAYHVLDHWTKQHKVFLGCFIDDPEDLQYRDELRERCAGTYFARLHPKLATIRAFSGFLTQSPLSVPYYHDRGLASWVDRVIAAEKPDCVFVYSSVMGQYVLDATPRPLRLLVDFVDVDLEKWAAYAAMKTFPAREIYRREARELLRFDRRWQRKPTLAYSFPNQRLNSFGRERQRFVLRSLPFQMASTQPISRPRMLAPGRTSQARQSSYSLARWTTGRMSMP